MANNYTNLKNNYMYGSKNRTNNFYMNYKNFTNDLEDPLFTGFTISIDNIYSPLFDAGGVNMEYLSKISNLDKDSNLSSKLYGLASIIENRLKKIHSNMEDSYLNDIISTNAKSSFDNNHKIGYGLQDDIILHKHDYGAIDYIYMVDKQKKSMTQSFNTLASSSGASTTTQIVDKDYEERLRKAREAENNIEEDDDIIIDGGMLPEIIVTPGGNFNYVNDEDNISPGIDEFVEEDSTAEDFLEKFGIKQGLSENESSSYYQSIIDNKKEEENHNDNIDKLNQISNQYDDLLNELNECKQKINEYRDLLDEYELDAEDLESELNSLKIEAEGYLSDFNALIEEEKSNTTVVTYGNENDDENDIDTSGSIILDEVVVNRDPVLDNIRYHLNRIYNEYIYLKENYQVDYPHLDKCNFIDGKYLPSDYNSVMYGKIVAYSEIEFPNSDIEMESKLNEYTRLYNDISCKLYGTNENGEPNSPYSASENSLYSQYITANENVQLDNYNQAEYNKEEYLDKANKTNSLSDTNTLTSAQSDKVQDYIYLLMHQGNNVNNEDKIQSYVSELMKQGKDDESSITDVNDNSDKYQKDINTVDIDGDINTIEAQMNKKVNDIILDAPQSCLDLLGFINGMKTLTEDYPYIFQSITGLDDAYKKYFEVKDPYLGSGDDKIVITCYESVDMRVTSMFNKYFNAVYDRQYRRERVPINLRRFNCSIFVHDIRNFRHALSILYKTLKKQDSSITDKFAEDNDNPTSKILEIALNHLSAVEFKFIDCEILPEETGNIFSDIGNAELGEQTTTTFAFKYGNCIINMLPFSDLMKYYNTDGKRDDLGNEDNIVKGTFDNDEITKERKINVSTDQQKTWREEEIKIYGEKYEQYSNVINPGMQSEGTLYDTQYEDRFIRPKIGEQNEKITNMESQLLSGFNRSYLGNVNNDDIYEWNANRYSFYTGAPTYIPSPLHEINAKGLLDRAPYDLNLALIRAMTGISASVGIPTIDVIRSFGLRDYMNQPHMNPEYTNLGHIHQHTYTNGKATNLGNVNDNINNTDIIDDLGMLNENTKDKGIRTYAGHIQENTEPIGEFTDEGKVNMNTSEQDAPTEIGNIYPNMNNNENYTEIGNIYGKLNEGDILTHIDTLDMNSRENGKYVDLGIVDLNANNTNTNNNTNNTNDDTSLTTNIGNIYDTNTNTDDVKEIGNIYDGDIEVGGEYKSTKAFDMPNQTGVYDNIGGINLNSTEGDILTEIGSTDNIIPEETGKYREIEKIDLSYRESQVVDNLGTAFTQSINKIIPTELGNINVSEDSFGTYEDVGKVNLESHTGNTIEKLGHVYEETITSKEIKDLGEVYNNMRRPEKIKDLGNNYDTIYEKPEVKELGNRYNEEIHETEVKNLGEVNLESHESNIIKDLGDNKDKINEGDDIEYIGNSYQEELNMKDVKDLGNVYLK